MDESIAYLKEKFGLGEVDVHTYSPLTLAYMGDAAYELVIRTMLVWTGGTVSPPSCTACPAAW